MKSKPIVLLECLVWNKESHGLFDYESTESKTSSFTVQVNSKVYRHGNYEYNI